MWRIHKILNSEYKISFWRIPKWCSLSFQNLFSRIILKNRNQINPKCVLFIFPCFSFFFRSKSNFHNSPRFALGREKKKERERERRVSEQGIGFPHLRYAIDGK